MSGAKPFRSGFCNPSFPLDDPSHGRCAGGYTSGQPGSPLLPCSCECHTLECADTVDGPRLGVYDDLDEDLYHSDPTSVSASGMKTILQSPAHFQHYRQHPKTSDAMALGTVAHTMILGKGAKYVAVEGNRNRNDVKAAIAEAEAEGKVVLKPEQLAAAERMANAVLSHPIAARLLTSPGRSEVSMFAKDPVHGIIRRCRWDRLGDDGIGVDLKTGRSSNPDALPKQIHDFGYDLSGAWYQHVADLLGVEIVASALVFVDSTEPHPVVVVELSRDFLDRGAALSEKALRRYTECIQSGLWPGYADDSFLTISPPRWAATADQILIPEGTAA